MKNNFFKKIILGVMIMFFVGSAFAIAQEYIPLEPGLWKEAEVMGENDAWISTTNLNDFLEKVFNFGIAIAVAAAVIMMTWGGIKYMTTDSWNKKQEGKEVIINALKGLALAIVSWLILYTINPELVDFSKNKIVSPESDTTTSTTE